MAPLFWGIAEKIIGAKKAGVELFLTPIENCSDIANEEKVIHFFQVYHIFHPMQISIIFE